MAFAGAFAVSVAVALIAGIGSRANTVRLLLAGMAVSAVCSAFSNFIIYRTRSAERVQSVMHWTMGGLGAAKWGTNAVTLTVVLLCFLFFWSRFRSLNLMLLGDETAVALGTNSRRRRIVYMLVSSLMVGFAVFSAGMIGFVGLLVPHVMRMLFGGDHRRLLPLCALGGAIFLVWADVLCRIIIPGAELPIGILTAMLGAPFFVYLMASRKYSFGGQPQ
jgi:iron complex transport system permease protein